jgi:hypothetical protein
MIVQLQHHGEEKRFGKLFNGIIPRVTGSAVESGRVTAWVMRLNLRVIRFG